MAVSYVRTHTTGTGTAGSAAATVATAAIPADDLVLVYISVRGTGASTPALPTNVTLSGQSFTRLAAAYNSAGGAHGALYALTATATISVGQTCAVTGIGGGAIAVQMWQYHGDAGAVSATLRSSGSGTSFTLPGGGQWGVVGATSQEKNGSDPFGSLTAYDTSSAGTGGPTNYVTSSIAGSSTVTTSTVTLSNGSWVTADISEDVEPEGTASLTGTGSTSASGSVAIAGSASLTGSGATSATGVVGTSSGATLVGTGDTTASGQVAVVVTGEATLTGSGTTSASGSAGVYGAVALVGTGVTTATGSAGGTQRGFPCAMVDSFLDTYYDDPYLQLHVGDPGADGTASPATGDTSRAQATTGAASDGVKTMSGTAGPWSNSSADESVTDLSLWSSSTGGTFLASVELTDPIPWLAGGQITVTALTMTFECLAGGA